MKVNLKNSMIFMGILLLVLSGILINGKLNFGKNVYVVSPQKNVSMEEDTKESDDLNNENTETLKNEEIIVYISGEVKTPGVVNLNNGDRLVNAIEKLGGLTENADLNRVNLAIKLEDGFHYIIPRIGENQQQEENNISEEVSSISVYENTQDNNSVKATNTKNNSSSKININNATVEQLNSLPGIGDVIAKRIIDYREQNGRFKSIEDLNNVSGIGDKKFEGIKELIIVN